MSLIPFAPLKLVCYPRFDSCAPAHFDLSVCPSMSLASPRLHSRSYPRHFTFYVAHPIRSIPEFLSTQPHPAFRNNPLQKLQQTILKLVRCPRSLAPALVTLPSMSLIPFAPFGRCNGKRTNVRCARSRSQCLTLQAACVAGKTSHSDVATAIGRMQPIRLRSRLRTTSAWQAGRAHWRLQD